ncbi:Aste57867_9673 [Aphanomyces stellatus]|uniref:Aste57867_9673 protein n=1 Tax=Aphanomyces stellatus TaxID=120398 RepID=A0A485KNH1_9STRA|nr:hypothetical protein As57867_009635 [Aphanomyces stellatus]VFT86552.1 Aste57867_9673 [Aphanomyces stellatus]
MESLSGQILAVDASIWLTQFVKAMRDPEDGSMMRNAHLLGTFRRVSKLLFYGIRPVFVFDGDTPAIKLKTLHQRRSRREKSQISLTQTAQKILLKHLKEKDFAAENGIVQIESTTVQHTSSEVNNAVISSPEARNASSIDSDDDESWRYQHDQFESFQRDRRQEARDTFLTLAGKPEEYSLAQIRTFLKSSQINREMKAKTNALDSPESGRRISSDAERRYVYVKKVSSSAKGNTVPCDSNAPILDNLNLSIGVFSDYVRKQAEYERIPISKEKQCSELQKAESSEYSNSVLLESKHPDWFAKESTQSHSTESLRWTREKDEPGEKDKKQLSASNFQQDEAFFPWDEEEETKASLESDGDGSDIDWEDVDVSNGTDTVPLNNEIPLKEIDSTYLSQGNDDLDVVDTVTRSDITTPISKGQKSDFDNTIEDAMAKNTLDFASMPSIRRDPLKTTISYDSDLTFDRYGLDDINDDEIMQLQNEPNADALQSAMSTASNLTQWAAGAVKRAILNHHDRSIQNVSPKYGKINTSEWNEMETPRYLTRQTLVDTPQQDDPVVPLQYESKHGDTDDELKKFRNQQMREVDGVTDDMKSQVMDLLRLFGVPFLVCPMEAEAQCAMLETLGLVNGVITDDSDIFAFGGKRVYKNMFKESKFVEAFFAEDIERELGLNQDSMIALALLLGSDYTDGIRGVGIVNATEIVHAFETLEGLHKFKQWVHEYNLQEQIKPHKKLTELEISKLDALERFKYNHHTIRRHWHVSDIFPNPQVIKAYRNPETDKSNSRFSWSMPDLANLRVFCGAAFGWPMEKVNATLLPVIQAASRGLQTQTRIDNYFTSYQDNIKYAKIKSKRLKAVVNEIQGMYMTNEFAFSVLNCIYTVDKKRSRN